MRTRTTWSELLHPGDAASFFDRDPPPPFEVEAREFSPANAWWLAELSRLVYRHQGEGDEREPAPSRSDFLRRAGLAQLRFFDSGRSGTQAFLVASERPAFAALVFRGTELRLLDFATDAAFGQVPLATDGATQVHAGFKHALDSVWPGIAAALEGLAVPVYYAGHSLGGALATLACARLAPQAAYTFGSPLVGDSAFAGSLRGLPLYRLVNGADLVARIPPEGLGFVHGGELHRIGPPYDPPGADAPKLGPLEKAFLSWPDPPPLLADHAALNYVENLPRG